MAAAAAAKGGGGWMDTILNLIPGRRAAATNEPSEEAVRRLHETLRCAPVLRRVHKLFSLQALLASATLSTEQRGACMMALLLLPADCGLISLSQSTTIGKP